MTKKSKIKSKSKKPAAGEPTASAGKFDVVCPGCKGSFHETTEHYDPNVMPRPNMCILKQPYRAWMWEDFGQLGSSALGDMCCPSCGYPYVLGCGRLLVKPVAAAVTAALAAPAEGTPAEGNNNGVEPNSNDSSIIDVAAEDESLPSGGRFICPICGEPYDYRIALMAHMKTHNEAEFKDI